MLETGPEAGAGSGVHSLALRVYYEDTDAGGVVYYANYLKFAERARTEFLRGLGIESSALMAEDGVALAVRRCTIDFLRPARLDDSIRVDSRLLKVGGATLEAEQVIRRDAETLVRIELKLGCMTTAGKPVRLPGRLKSRLDEYSCSNE